MKVKDIQAAIAKGNVVAVTDSQQHYVVLDAEPMPSEYSYGRNRQKNSFRVARYGLNEQGVGEQTHILNHPLMGRRLVRMISYGAAVVELRDMATEAVLRKEAKAESQRIAEALITAFPHLTHNYAVWQARFSFTPAELQALLVTALQSSEQVVPV